MTPEMMVTLMKFQQKLANAICCAANKEIDCGRDLLLSAEKITLDFEATIAQSAPDPPRPVWLLRRDDGRFHGTDPKNPHALGAFADPQDERVFRFSSETEAANYAQRINLFRLLAPFQYAPEVKG